MNPYDSFFDNMLVMIKDAMSTEIRRLPVYTGDIGAGDICSNDVRQDRYLTGHNRIII